MSKQNKACLHSIQSHMEHHHNGFQLLKLLHSLDSSLIPLALIQAVLEATLPYLSLFLSAEIIDQLLAKHFHSAIKFSIALIALNLTIHILTSILTYCCYVGRRNSQIQFKILMRKKALELDFETMEKASIIDKITYTEKTSSMYGSIDVLLNHYQDYVMNLLSLVTSITLVIHLCFTDTATGGYFRILSSPVITLLILVLSYLIHFILYQKKMKTIKEEEQQIFRNHTGVENHFAYLLDGILLNYEAGKVIRIYQMQQMLKENIGRVQIRSRMLFKTMCNLETKKETNESLLNSIFIIVSYFVVTIKILAGSITVGSFTKYTGALAQFSLCLTRLQSLDIDIKRITDYMKVFQDFMSLENKRETGSIPIEKRIDHVYELEFHDVSFSYPETTIKVLDHVNCKLTLKDKMAVVGGNGAGKTTFIKLLCRLYDPTEGMITLNGIDIRKYNYEEYLTLFSVVFQDFNLFSCPISENVACSTKYDEERIWNCLQEVGVDQVIRNLPNQLNTSLKKYSEDGVDLSGGEQQKIAIARALYKDAPFVILDEPTAALDPMSEYEIYKNFDAIVKDKTSIYISHRMSSCRFCDDIIVFDNGHIVERGNHEQLLNLDGYYTKMWNAQAQYYMN